MAGKIDASEQVKFLLSCIRNTNNGRVSWIVSQSRTLGQAS